MCCICVRSTTATVGYCAFQLISGLKLFFKNMMNVLKAVGFKESAKKKVLFCKLQFEQLTMSIEWEKKNGLWAKADIIFKLELCVSCLQINVFAQLQITDIKAPQSWVATKNNSLPAFFFFLCKSVQTWGLCFVLFSCFVFLLAPSLTAGGGVGGCKAILNR